MEGSHVVNVPVALQLFAVKRSLQQIFEGGHAADAPNAVGDFELPVLPPHIFMPARRGERLLAAARRGACTPPAGAPPLGPEHGSTPERPCAVARGAKTSIYL